MMTTLRTYERPTTIEQALQQLTSPDAIALAGGALLFGHNDLPYETIIDLQDVPELRQITAVANGLNIGAAVTLQEVVESDAVPQFLKQSLVRALPLNIRNGASVGETLLLEQPPREWLAALVAHDAGVSLRLPNGEDVSEGIACLFDGSSAHRLRDSIVTMLSVPALGPLEAIGAAYVARTPADEPIVNAATFVELDAARRVVTAFAAICGASSGPVINLSLSTLIGQPFDEANIASAVKAVAAHVEPIGDYLGSAEYRREMARVTVQRALLDCRAALG